MTPEEELAKRRIRLELDRQERERNLRAQTDALAGALDRLRGCYWATLGGKSVRDADEAFAECDAALAAYRPGTGGRG